MVEVHPVGVGMTPFVKPGQNEAYPVMAASAVKAALQDAGVDYADIQQAFVGYVYGDSTAGQRALYDVGMTGIPIVNVNNNCSTGSTALMLAVNAVVSGQADCVLALGFEQMTPGAIGEIFKDRPSPFQPFDALTDELVDVDLPLALRYFGGAGRAHMEEFGTPLEAFAKVRAKASRHAVHNPKALFRKELSVEDVMESPMLWPGVMTRLMACPPTCGAAAAVIASGDFARRKGLDTRVKVRAQAMTTDTAVTFEKKDMRELVGFSMAREAARQVYEKTGVGPDAIDVVEMHDCFAQNELVSYEALGLCGIGEAASFIDAGNNTYGGKVVTNPSGGLLSKGHPLGATGLAQCTELVEQLRGNAGARQVEGARLALQHNLGLGGACVVTLYEGSAA